ncbi:MAG: TIGR03668 family PPOX class F420-dependent oxidoreductase [Ktedonobacterales bacterium]
MAQRAELTENEAAFARAERVARLATADVEGHPWVVPVCYAYDGAHFYSPLDEKPKRTAARNLRRVRNIEARAEASLLIDHYEDDWSRLGYLLIQTKAELVEPGSQQHTRALPLLHDRYPQYQTMNLEEQPVIALTPTHVVSWGPALHPDFAAPTSQWLQSGRGLEFLPLAQNRRSVRVFQPRPVPRPALETMLEAAAWAPSPHGRQPWRFVVLTHEQPKGLLAAAMGTEWQRTLAMDGEPEEITQIRLEKSRERIRSAPALVLVCLYLEGLDQYPDPSRQRAEEVMAIQSLGASVQNMLLAAYTVGLDCGWMCAPLFCPDTVCSALDLDSSRLIPHALIAVGYAAQDPKRRPRRPLGELIVRFD